MKNKFQEAAMHGNWAAMGAYADYLWEQNIEEALVVGLRFCFKYRKFPRVGKLHSIVFWWHSSKLNAIPKNRHILPLFLEQLIYHDYSSAKSAITAVGRVIIKINTSFKEII